MSDELIALLMQDSGNTEWYTPAWVVEIAREVMGGIDYDPASSLEANKVVKARLYNTAPLWDQVAVSFDDGLPVMAMRRKDYETLPYHWRLLPERSRVWMNHPFGRGERPCYDTNIFSGCTKRQCAQRGYHIYEYVPGNQAWIRMIHEAIESDHISAACGICFAATNATWFRPLLDNAALGFFYSRVNYETVDAQGDRQRVSGATKDSVMYYLGPDVDRFRAVFEGGGHGKVKI